MKYMVGGVVLNLPTSASNGDEEPKKLNIFPQFSDFVRELSN